MRFDPLQPGKLVRRHKRFLADVALPDGEIITAHCPNTGRMEGCAVPGSPVMLSRSTNPARRLACTLELVHAGGRWLNVNTLRPNALVQEALEEGRLDELRGWRFVRREAPWRHSRFDLLLQGPDGRPCFIEVKNVTLFADGVAYFPDAVTERGVRHLDGLSQVVKAGGRAVQFFVVNDPDCRLFRPADLVHAAYGKALRRAARRGVEVLAYAWDTTVEGMTLAGPIAVDLGRRRRDWVW